MTIIRRKNPLGELVSLRRAMDRLSEDSFVRPDSDCSGDEHQLALDIRTSGDALAEQSRDEDDERDGVAEHGA